MSVYTPDGHDYFEGVNELYEQLSYLDSFIFKLNKEFFIFKTNFMLCKYYVYGLYDVYTCWHCYPIIEYRWDKAYITSDGSSIFAKSRPYISVI